MRVTDRAGASLGDYLTRGSDAQQRLLRLMDDGHARRRHGVELGQPSSAEYQRRVSDHFARASVGFAVIGPDKRPRYFLGNPRTGEAAWINPTHEKRSTYFQTYEGVAAYLQSARRAHPQDKWRAVDPHTARVVARGIGSCDRRPPPRGLDR